MSTLDIGIPIDESTWSSPNYTPSALVAQVYGLPREVDAIAIHHWNAVEYNPTFDATSSHLCRAGGNTSAHFVVQAGRVACLVSTVDAAWHAGSAWGNARTIGIECSPWATDADLQAIASLIRWLEKFYGKSLDVYRHMDFSATACPGRYKDMIGKLVDMVNAGPPAVGGNAISVATVGMVPPVTGYKVTQAFNAGQDLATNLGGGHTGTDYGTPVGTSVVAVAGGTVLWADWADNLPQTSWADRWYLVGGRYGGLTTSAGIVVVIDHGGYLSISAHLNETQLNTGDAVKRGQEIGKSGATGFVYAPHLHFEILPKPFAWSNGFYGKTDPQTFIQARAATAAVQAQDWTDMATQKEVEDAAYRAARNAINEKFAEPFVRQGPTAKAAFGEKTTSFNSIGRWWDEAQMKDAAASQAIITAVNKLDSKVDTVTARMDALSTTAGKAPTMPTIIEGVSVEQLRQIIREEIDKTVLGAK